jgi:hypothetical protein
MTHGRMERKEKKNDPTPSTAPSSEEGEGKLSIAKFWEQEEEGKGKAVKRTGKMVNQKN